MIIKKLLAILGVIILFFTKPAFANPACGVCTVAVGAALGISRKLGVDDTVVGVWLGALLMLIAFWTMTFCVRRGWKFRWMGALFIVISFSLIIPIYTMDYISYGARTILHVDSFLVSVLLGGAIFFFSEVAYMVMKEGNGGHAHFPFEKVVIPVVSLIIASVAFYFGADYIITNADVDMPLVLPSADDLM